MMYCCVLTRCLQLVARLYAGAAGHIPQKEGGALITGKVCRSTDSYVCVSHSHDAILAAFLRIRACLSRGTLHLHPFIMRERFMGSAGE